MELSEKERSVLTILQRGIKLTEQPFLNMPLPESDVLSLLARAGEAGLIRRFGGIFDARRLGYQSVLCAVDTDPENIEEKAAIISQHPGVTHCYERLPLNNNRHYPRLWFTLAVLHDRFEDEVSALRSELSSTKLLLLPALRRFKIDVVFDLRTRDRSELFPGSAPSRDKPDTFPQLSEQDRAVVRLLDQNIPVTKRPFDGIAEQMGMTVPDLLHLLQTWQNTGMLRRIAAVLHHRRAGFGVNGMCVWKVEDDVISAGRQVASRREVTHCYQRPCLTEFPFDLYAMIHSDTSGKIMQICEEITAECRLCPGLIFVSTREFKKTSMRYFT